MSAGTSQKEDLLIQVRDILRKDEIKLWLPPYFSEANGSCKAEISNLSVEVSKKYEFPFEQCLQIINELQMNALENLKHNTRFQESGVATLKIKVVDHGKPPIMIVKEVMLDCTGSDLKENICQDIFVTIEQVKLISAGRVLNNTDSLNTQRVKNGQQMLAIVVAESPEQFAKNEDAVKQLETVRTDSQLLALDNDYMRLEDQFGNTLQIPTAEKTALVVALALHEKGRAALKKDDYSTALVFFLEADQEFEKCSSTFVKLVDNHALLDLDIAWCYLCLQSFTHLPEAQDRLQKCEAKFCKTYGSNMERIIALKGNASNEQCLFTRLHLLQAVLLYHQNRRSESLTLFKQVEKELRDLTVNEESIAMLLEIGFSAAEARLGLRATKGNVNEAADYISENRRKRYEARKKALAEEIYEKCVSSSCSYQADYVFIRREKQKLGVCADGKQYVDPNFLKILVNMGYNKEAGRVALKMCNNIISDSVQYIVDNPAPGSCQSASRELNDLIEDLVSQLMDAGFDPRMAKLALQKHNGDIAGATEELLENDGIVSGDLSSLDISQESIESIKRRKKEEKEKEQAWERLKDDISIVDDDHLDMNLAQEEMFLKQYLSLLEKN
ncbi:hypothetical protein HUJ04_010676 [Dendroctonus ponderosae]|nr:hypothetical protein HUJ04_010676 [Dendroctonus ponderosae]